MPAPFYLCRFGSCTSTRPELSVPAFAAPLPAFSAQALAASVAASAAEPPVSLLPEEACAAEEALASFPAEARAAAVVQREEESADAAPVGSGSAAAGSGSAAVGSGSAPAEWLLDEQLRDDCSVEPQADDSSQAGWAEDGSAAMRDVGLFPADCSAVSLLDDLADSSPDDCSVALARAESAATMDDLAGLE